MSVRLWGCAARRRLTSRLSARCTSNNVIHKELQELKKLKELDEKHWKETWTKAEAERVGDETKWQATWARAEEEIRSERTAKEKLEKLVTAMEEKEKLQQRSHALRIVLSGRGRRTTS